MKRILRGFLLALVVSSVTICFTSVGKSYAQEDTPTQEQITLFKSDIELKENTDILIKEEIHYFFPTSRHGVIREIPVDYKVQAGFKRPTTLTLQDIHYYEKDNPDRKFSEYERSSESGYVIFKIGDPDVTIQGEYVYVIEYTLRNAVNYFEDYDELYLNVTGTGWNVPIKEAYANIKVPGEITDELCFTGPIDSTLSNCSFESVSEQEVTVSVDEELETFEGYTVVLKMPKGTLKDTRGRQRIAFLLSNIGVLLPVPIFFLLLTVLKKKGKNKKLTIIPHFEPAEGMYPLLAGYVHDAKLDSKHITAQIIQLAIDGHIKIKQEKKNKYILAKDNIEKEIKEGTVESLYSGLFKGKDSVNSKKIPSDFYLTVKSLGTQLENLAYEKNYFSKKRKKLRTTLSLLGFGGLFLSFMTIGHLADIAAVGWGVGLILSSILSLIFSSKVDLKAKEGNEMYYELEGLKRYIDTAEKHRIEFHNDPEKFRGVFETLLPYAIIFGLEKKWANEFEDIYKEPPSWYEGDVSSFNTYMLASSIARVSKNVKTKSVAPNSAGGFRSSHGASGGSGFSGGSSGGGFGGGGGGSW
jgi:uncharacterized membrane protein YgcG